MIIPFSFDRGGPLASRASRLFLCAGTSNQSWKVCDFRTTFLPPRDFGVLGGSYLNNAVPPYFVRCGLIVRQAMEQAGSIQRESARLLGCGNVEIKSIWATFGNGHPLVTLPVVLGGNSFGGWRRLARSTVLRARWNHLFRAIDGVNR